MLTIIKKAYMLPRIISVVSDSWRKILSGRWDLLFEHFHPSLDGHFTSAFFKDKITEAHGNGEVAWGTNEHAKKIVVL